MIVNSNNQIQNLTTRDILKAIAAISMIIDHFGWLFLENDPFFRCAGRLAAPIYFYLIGHADNYPLNGKLLVYGIIVTVFFSLHNQAFMFDILVTFLFTRWLLQYKQNFLQSGMKLGLSFFSLVLINYFLMTVISYGTLGIIWSITGYLQKKNSVHLWWWIILTLVASYFYLILLLQPPENPIIDLCYFIILLIFGLIAYIFRIIKVNLPVMFQGLVYFLSKRSLEIYVLHLCTFILLRWLLDLI